MGGQGSGRLPGTKAVCGTTAKYQYHRKRKENCEVCKAAMREFQRLRTGSKPRAIRQSPAVRKQDRRDWLIEQKMSRVGCFDCGLKVEPHITYVFDYDHREPHLKSFTISQYLHHFTESRLLQEMNKCDLVCANCHRHRTHAQQQTGILTGYRRDRHHLEQSTCQDWVLTLF
jgi:hypothetical protein